MKRTLQFSALLLLALTMCFLWGRVANAQALSFRATAPSGSAAYKQTQGSYICLDYPLCLSQLLGSATTDDIQLSVNGKVWDFSPSTMTFPNGNQLNGSNAVAGWTTVFDCDFTKQPYQSISSDGTFTMCGNANWVKWGSGGESTHAFVDAGLSIQPASAPDYFQGIRSAPVIGIPLNAVIPNLTWDTPVRIWAAFVSANGAANNDECFFGIDNGIDGGSNTGNGVAGMTYAFAGAFGMTSNSYTNSGSNSWTGGLYIGNGQTNALTYPLTNNGVTQNAGVLQAPAYLLTGMGTRNDVEIFTGYYDGGSWPPFYPAGGIQGVTPKSVMYPIVQSTANPQVDMSRMIGNITQVPDAGAAFAYVAGKRGGSATALNCLYARLRIDYWQGL